MPDYSKAVIYTIKSKDNLYVGSTVNFRSRKYQHKEVLHNENNKKHNFKIYKTIRENGFEWDMKPYKEFPCENKIQLSIEEERIRQELNADMNSNSCYVFNKKEKILEQHKKWRLANPEKVLENSKKNKEKMRETSKLYYQKNKEVISEKNKKARQIERNKTKMGV